MQWCRGTSMHIRAQTPPDFGTHPSADICLSAGIKEATNIYHIKTHYFTSHQRLVTPAESAHCS